MGKVMKIILVVACVLLVGAIIGGAVAYVQHSSKDEHVHTKVVFDAIEPTCTESGLTQGVSCSECGAVLVERITVNPLGHSEVVFKGKSPTCLETGLTDGTCCSRCNEVIVPQSVVQKVGHSFQNGACVGCGLSEKYNISSIRLVQVGARMRFEISGTYTGNYVLSDFVLDAQRVDGATLSTVAVLSCSLSASNGIFTLQGDITDLDKARYIFHLTVKGNTENNNIVNVANVARGNILLSKNYILDAQDVFGVGNGTYVVLTVQ